MTTPILNIYDDGQGRFGPLTSLCAVFEVRTGSLQTGRRIEKALDRPVGAYWVPDRLAGVVSQRHPDSRVNPGSASEGACLLVNARWAGLAFAQEVNDFELGQALVQSDGQVIAAYLNGHDAGMFIASGFLVLPDQTRTVRLKKRVLIDRPWHLLDELPANLIADLSASDEPVFQPSEHPGVTTFGDHPIRIGEGARVMPTVVIDAEYGPVVIESGAVINPLTVLQGPCFIGKDSVLVSHSSIRRNTVIGPSCKIGGEVAGSIIQGYTNKAHAGYLGDSLVGSWVNLGADTNVSNLKNTYNPVRVQLDEHSPQEDTGRTFQGAIIGDYVRTAIGTRLVTGTVIHPGCMLAVTGWSPKLATPLGFYTDAGRQAYDTEKLIATLRAVMARRDTRLTSDEEALIRSLAVNG
jgi:UDP-N-acetylglucosamine diphosphorylase/glucosamine-1-phosphate N-acetyltransferase